MPVQNPIEKKAGIHTGHVIKNRTIPFMGIGMKCKPKTKRNAILINTLNVLIADAFSAIKPYLAHSGCGRLAL